MRSVTLGTSLAAVVGLAALPLVPLACGSGGNGNTADSGTPPIEAGIDGTAEDASMETGPEAGPMEAAPASDGSIDASLPPAAGSTGAFGVVTVNGKQKMYLPTSDSTVTGNAIIAVVDVGVVGNGASGAPALIKDIDLGLPNGATATGGDASMIVAASTGSNDVWFIDPTTDSVVKHITLDTTYGQSFFSGGGGYVTGIATDTATHTAILSVWNGLALVDLTTQSITKVIQAPPSENFGFDSVHHLIYAPFYDCPYSKANGMSPLTCNSPMAPEGGVMPAGLSVIDLSDETVYTYEDPAAADPTIPLGGNPDSAGVDPVSQIVIVPAEHNGYESVLDFSKASFDKASKTVTAPHTILMGLGDEGVAIEPMSHIAFWEGEATADVAAASAPLASMGSPIYVEGSMPNLPGGGTYSNLTDPHGIGVAASIINGKPVGFIVDAGRKWVARVDLTAFVALESPDASIMVTSTQLQGVVTYLDSSTNE